MIHTPKGEMIIILTSLVISDTVLPLFTLPTLHFYTFEFCTNMTAYVSLL